jgi:hypothetical protein
MLASMERDPLPSWYSTRARRRAIAAASMLANSLMWANAAVSWKLAPSDRAFHVSLVLTALAILIYTPVAGLLNSATRGSTALAERQLDERQLADRLRAHSIAFRGTQILIPIVVVVALVDEHGNGRNATVPMAAFVLVMLALWLTLLSLPQAIAAWRLPDPPAEHEAEHEVEAEAIP